MNIDYSTQKLADNINLTMITDPKFKTNSIVVRFITKHEAEYASANALFADMLSSANQNYPTLTMLAQKCSELYGGSLWSRCFTIGNNHVLQFGASFILDNLALDGENLSYEMANLLTDCIFMPVFDEKNCDMVLFESMKKNLIDTIEAEINEKRRYALKRAARIAYEGEPLAISTFGDLEDAKVLTNMDIYKAYKRVLDTAHIEITFAGGGGFEPAIDVIRKAFMPLAKKSAHKPVYIYSSKLKETPANAAEKMDVNQCKLILVYKTDNKNIICNKLMAAMLGGTAFSKLFVNVRERLSLCYYCAARFQEDRCSMIIDSGIEKDNIEKAINEIKKQLEAMQNGDFTDDEMANTKLSIADSVKGTYDHVSEMISWYFTQTVRGTDYSPEKHIEILNSISREEIIDAAKSLVLDTVYLMENTEESTNE